MYEYAKKGVEFTFCDRPFRIVDTPKQNKFDTITIEHLTGGERLLVPGNMLEGLLRLRQEYTEEDWP